ncbi:MAG TPA: hypothetical protein DDY13_08765 [Cytophagales bacterium]|jgi:adenylate cyclase|nr:hypothetical protein [Cytophagales bacterium]
MKSLSLIKTWAYYVFVWMAFTTITNWFLVSGIKWVLQFFDLEDVFLEDDIARYVVSNYQYLEGFLFSIFFGTIFFLINHFLDRWKILHKVTFAQVLLFKSGLYLLGLILVFWIVASLLMALDIAPIDDLGFLSQKGNHHLIVLPIAIMIIMVTIGINFMQQIDRMFGPGKLWKIFIGKYFNPKVEERIFMFLDLKSSTAIAEKLGHIEYSRFLQHSFREMNKVVARSQAEIYQYVGDEVVLTWPDTPSNRLNAVKTFFDIDDEISKNKGHFKSVFDIVPVFKAGINAGVVTVAEVGSIKSEIAYHGVTINTASRVQHLCNQYSSGLLATEHALVIKLLEKQYIVDKLGWVKIEGKKNEVCLFSISRKSVENV